MSTGAPLLKSENEGKHEENIPAKTLKSMTLAVMFTASDNRNSELYQEGGSSGSGSTPGRSANSETLDPQSDVEMDDSSSVNRTSTSNPADKRTRERDDEERASKAIGTDSNPKEKNVILLVLSKQVFFVFIRQKKETKK